MNPMDLGHLIEGVIEQDPMTERYVIRTVDSDGKPFSYDVQEALSKLKGKEVRLTLTTFENLEKLARMVEAQGGGDVLGIYPSDLNR